MPAVTRVGDPDVPHCSPMVRAVGSGSVFVNGRPISIQGSVNTVHLIPFGRKCLPHVGSIILGSTTVKVHGLGAGRIGDTLLACTFVAVGSANVFAGG
jgi:uncharacterized Zn-binding protein involved in type VI secretion